VLRQISLITVILHGRALCQVLRAAEERAAAAAAALLEEEEEEERARAPKEASRQRRKKKGRQTRGAVAPTHTPSMTVPEQGPSSAPEPSESWDDTQVR
jgi:hypothetical protein